MLVLGVGALVVGLVAVGLGIWGIVLVVIGTQPCDPDQRCEGWAAFFGVGMIAVAAIGAILAALLGVGAWATRRSGVRSTAADGA